MNSKTNVTVQMLAAVLIILLSVGLVAENSAVAKDTAVIDNPGARHNPDRFKNEIDLIEKAKDRETKIKLLREMLGSVPKHPDNIMLEHRLAVQIAGVTDPQTHQYIGRDDARRIYERIVKDYNHMDYYSQDMPNYLYSSQMLDSTQMLVPICASAAGVYHKDPEAARKYFYMAMECLKQTYQRRKKDWQSAEAPKKPLEDSPFSGPIEISKWESRMYMWQKHKDHAALGDVLHKFELRLMKEAVKAYLLSYLSKDGVYDVDYPSFHQDEILKAMMKIKKDNQSKIMKAAMKINMDFPNTPIADYASEYADIICIVLNRARLRTKQK